jgi:DNA-binding response OmpR family regulator
VTTGQSDVEVRFFNLVDDHEPDVIVLDCAGVLSAATDTILRVRRRTDVPIIVICRPVRALIEQYRGAGAADCVASPVELAVLNQSIQRIIAVSGPRASRGAGD